MGHCIKLIAHTITADMYMYPHPQTMAKCTIVATLSIAIDNVSAIVHFAIKWYAIANLVLERYAPPTSKVAESNSISVNCTAQLCNGRLGQVTERSEWVTTAGT